MIDNVRHFLYMGGYGFYVWASYGAVITFLLIQWILPWRRWQQYSSKQSSSHE